MIIYTDIIYYHFFIVKIKNHVYFLQMRLYKENCLCYNITVIKLLSITERVVV